MSRNTRTRVVGTVGVMYLVLVLTSWALLGWQALVGYTLGTCMTTLVICAVVGSNEEWARRIEDSPLPLPHIGPDHQVHGFCPKCRSDLDKVGTDIYLGDDQGDPALIGCRSCRANLSKWTGTI